MARDCLRGLFGDRGREARPQSDADLQLTALPWVEAESNPWQVGLTMPAAGRRTSDTTGSVGIPGAGIVFFRNYTLSAQWGRRNADGGVLRAADGSTLSVPVTGPLEGTTLRGDGWSVTLNAGWLVQPAARPSSFTIVREK